MASKINVPFPIFTDVDGDPLEDGYIYIGTAGLDPETNQINTFWDSDLTIPAAQPIRTSGGYTQYSGSPGKVYVGEVNYSMTVKDKKTVLVWTDLYGAGINLATDADSITYTNHSAGAVTRILEERLDDILSIRDFGAVGDGITDDTVALNAAAAACSGGRTLIIPDGVYMYNPISGPLTFDGSDIYIFGSGTIKAITSVNTNLVLLSGNKIIWDGATIEGDGTVYSSYSSTTEDERWALFRVTGDDVNVRAVNVLNPYLIGLHCWGGNNITVGDGVIVRGGPVGAAVATFFQGIRFKDCTNLRILNPTVGANSAGGYPEEAIFGNDGSNVYIQATVEAAWDHGVYCILVDGLTINGCVTTTNQAGITVSPPSYEAEPTALTIISNNNVRASATPTSVTGFFMRDMHSAVITGNTVKGWARAYQMNPVQYGDVNNNIEGITFSNNTCREWTNFGLIISAGGLDLGKAQFIKIDNFDSTPKRDVLDANAAHIFLSYAANIGNAISITNSCLNDNGSHYPDNGINAFRIDNLSISNCKIRGVATTGIYLSDCDNSEISNNDLLDAGTTGISLDGSSVAANVHNNSIIDGQIHALSYGIDGTDTCTSCAIHSNRIIGASIVPIRRCQYSGHTNTFYGNSNGTDALTGLITLGVGTTTTFNNDNINIGLGYSSYVRLTPTNQAAATLISGANSPFVGVGDHVNGVSFKVRQAGSSLGTEQFFYEIVQ